MRRMMCHRGNDRDASDRSARDARRIVGIGAIFALFLGLQVGASVVEHDHGTVADGIECVVCHGVRVAPPPSQPVTRADAATEITVAPSRVPETPPPAVAVVSTDLPRGPPAA